MQKKQDEIDEAVRSLEGAVKAFNSSPDKEEPETPEGPKMINGDKAEWVHGSDEGLSFTSSASIEEFKEIRVDGNVISKENYQLKKGSTIVTINSSYLNSLQLGKHKLDIVSKNGTASGEFNIVSNKNKPDKPDKPDNPGNPDNPDKPSAPDADNKHKNKLDNKMDDISKVKDSRKTPLTGDRSHVSVYVIMCVAAAAYVFGILNYRNRRKLK